jgi:hypothetical protein
MSKELIYTPKGISNYTWLSRPDTKFNPDGVYTVTLAFEKTAPGVKELCKKLNDAYKKAQKPKKKAGKKPYIENEDGLDVGNGSTLKAAFSIRSYDFNGCGISLDLTAVMIVDLVEYTGGSFEFGDEDEGGFEGNAEEDNQLNEENWDEDDTGEEGNDSDSEDEPF